MKNESRDDETCLLKPIYSKFNNYLLVTGDSFLFALALKLPKLLEFYFSGRGAND